MFKFLSGLTRVVTYVVSTQYSTQSDLLVESFNFYRKWHGWHVIGIKSNMRTREVVSDVGYYWCVGKITL